MKAMRASDFECRHPVMLHQGIVGLAFGTYFIQRDDIVWQLVRNAGPPLDVTLERAAFAVATLLVGAGAVLCTWHRRHRYLGELLYAIGLASLAPGSGFLILVGGEALRLYRLSARERTVGQGVIAPEGVSAPPAPAGWRESIAKWGIFVTMVTFTITLQDRLAEILAGLVYVLSITLNVGSVRRRGGDASQARAGAA